MPATRRQRLDVEVALLEAETDLLHRLTRDGRVVPGKRAPTTAEVRAGVRFAELDRLVGDSAGRIAGIADRVRNATLDAVALDLGPLYGSDAAAVTGRLNALLDPMSDARLDDLKALVDEATEEAYAELVDLHQRAGAEVLGEVGRQRLPMPTGTAPAALGTAGERALRVQAERVTAAPVTRLITVARDAAAAAPPGELAVDVAIEAAETASKAGAEDLSRQAAAVAQDAGRAATLREVDARTGLDPREVYASELLDSNTCPPCSHVDGRDYPTLEEALADYPGNGGYASCDGGQRCRGTLVVVWATEAAPTVDDRRGEGPEAPPRQPVPPPPAPPALPPSTLSDDELADGLAGAALTDDTARATELGEELDRRDQAAGTPEPTPAPVEADPDAWGWSEDDQAREVAREVAEEYAGDAQAYARDLARASEEWEAAGGRVLGVVRDAAGNRRPQGRRIDAVREEWAVELERRYVELEDATRGALIRRDREVEFARKYGATAAPDVLMAGPARTAYYYASEEVRTVWAARPRITFAEFAVQRGVVDAKMVARARAASRARDDASMRAEEGTRSADGRARAQAKRRRQAIPPTEGDKLRKAWDRAARERRRAEKLRRDLERQVDGLP